uniref:Reverse transcriptase zinc-binding domain-containing protein n=1 Tax=Fagus sylvatica TaxID=28930 RepID=A0A2N9GUZ4_FAGSY
MGGRSKFKVESKEIVVEKGGNPPEGGGILMLLEKSDLFEVKSYHKVLTDKCSFSFPWKSIRKAKAFLMWTAARGKILAMDNLRK